MILMEIVISEILVTAAGMIVCRRCTARSKRSGEQCRKPALTSSRTQKCQLHGGKSYGPKTAGGKVASAAANYKNGAYSKASIEQVDKSRALLRVLEDATHLLGLVPKGTVRTTGRKPKLYIPLPNNEDILETIVALRDET
jgi:ribosomal protein L40E